MVAPYIRSSTANEQTQSSVSFVGVVYRADGVPATRPRRQRQQQQQQRHGAEEINITDKKQIIVWAVPWTGSLLMMIIANNTYLPLMLPGPNPPLPKFSTQSQTPASNVCLPARQVFFLTAQVHPPAESRLFPFFALFFFSSSSLLLVVFSTQRCRMVAFFIYLKISLPFVLLLVPTATLHVFRLLDRVMMGYVISPLVR